MQFQEQSCSLSPLLEGTPTLSQVTTFVTLHEQLLREKDKVSQLQQNQQEQASAHAQSILSLKNISDKQLKEWQERCELLQNIMQQKDQQITQLHQLIDLHKNKIEEQEASEQLSSYSQNTQIQHIHQLLLDIKSFLLSGGPQNSNQFIHQTIQELRKQLYTRTDPLELPDVKTCRQQKCVAAPQELSFLKDRISYLQKQLSKPKNNQVDASLLQIGQLAIKRLKTGLVKAQKQNNCIKATNKSLKNSLIQMTERLSSKQSAVHRLFQPSVISNDSCQSLQQSQPNSFSSDYLKLKNKLLKAKSQPIDQNYAALIKQFQMKQARKKLR